MTVSTLARLSRLDRDSVDRLLAGPSLSESIADRLAVALGRHPCEIWPDWFDPVTRWVEPLRPEAQ